MFRSSIALKLAGAVIAAALLTEGIFAYFNVRAHSRSLLAEVERHANQLSDAVKSSTEYDMLLNQRERIHDPIRRLGNQKSIERMRVMNKAGAVIYSSTNRRSAGWSTRRPRAVIAATRPTALSNTWR